MLNILHIIESLEFGGAEKVVLQLANGLSSKFNVNVCITKREGELLKEINKDVDVFFLGTKEGNDLSVINKIVKIIHNKNIDVVHIHNWGVYIESVIASKYAGTNRIIHTVHGPYMNYENTLISKVKVYVRHIIERISSMFVYRFVSVSDAISNYMVKEIGINRKKIKTIHNGIKGLIKKQNAEKKSNVINLVSVGRVAKVKNHKLLLDAIDRLSEEINIRLTIVGDGPELENIKQYSQKLSLNNKITFLGFRTDLDNILADMDICVVTSNYEGISIAILEAMSVAMPVIASNVGGNPETLIDGETGVLFEKGNVQALVEAIKKMVSNETLRLSMGSAGYERFIDLFHEDYVLQQYSNLYTEKDEDIEYAR